MDNGNNNGGTTVTVETPPASAPVETPAPQPGTTTTVETPIIPATK